MVCAYPSDIEIHILYLFTYLSNRKFAVIWLFAWPKYTMLISHIHIYIHIDIYVHMSGRNVSHRYLDGTGCLLFFLAVRRIFLALKRTCKRSQTFWPLARSPSALQKINIRAKNNRPELRLPEIQIPKYHNICMSPLPPCRPQPPCSCPPLCRCRRRRSQSSKNISPPTQVASSVVAKIPSWPGRLCSPFWSRFGLSVRISHL